MAILTSKPRGSLKRKSETTSTSEKKRKLLAAAPANGFAHSHRPHKLQSKSPHAYTKDSKTPDGTDSEVESNQQEEEEEPASEHGTEDEEEAAAGSAQLSSTEQTEQETTSRKTFAELGVIPELCDACTERGYKFPTPIQDQAIPTAIEGRDIIGLAETGSGKTAAFAIPMLQALMDKPQPLFGLILAPTRELAYQISQEVEALGAFIGVKTAVIVGGMREVDQAIALSKKPHIVVATPGRLFYHLQETKGFSLRTLKYLVMDEADRLLDEDFQKELDKILKVLPREGRRTLLFSATMSDKVQQLQRASLTNPLKIAISSTSHQTVKTLLQSWLLVQHKKKDLHLVYQLTIHAGQTTILFARTVAEVQRLAFLLRALGFGAIPLHGQLPQTARLGALNKFRSRSRDILVATDVAARGLDIPSVDLVLNYDLPGDSKTYVHRVGRTARAGKSGKAVSLVTQYDAELWLRLEKNLGTKVPMEEVPEDEVLLLKERVGEAQREAVRLVNDEKSRAGSRRKGQGGARGGRAPRGDARDLEER